VLKYVEDLRDQSIKSFINTENFLDRN
jgi:hypothetical protein